MARSAARTSVVLGSVMVSLVVGGACFKLDDDDCKLSDTCPGHSVDAFADEHGAECAACLRTYCSREATACDDVAVCRKAIGCGLQTDPAAIQRCYADTLALELDAGVTTAPWEITRPLEMCVGNRCSEACERDESDWSCRGEYALPVSVDVDAALYVSFYDGGFSPAPDVLVSYCNGAPDGCSEIGKTDAAGRVVTGRTRFVGDIYFKIEDVADPPTFPPTLFYSRPIEQSGSQPIAIYLIKSKTIGTSHETLLGSDAGVLGDRAQSIILTDACRLPLIFSAPGVTIRAADTPAPLCDADGGLPCAWYGGSDALPRLGQDASTGTSAGIVGLHGEVYDIEACSGGEVVASRRVRMVEGFLTVARLWPLTRKEAETRSGSCPP